MTRAGQAAFLAAVGLLLATWVAVAPASPLTDEPHVAEVSAKESFTGGDCYVDFEVDGRDLADDERLLVDGGRSLRATVVVDPGEFNEYDPWYHGLMVEKGGRVTVSLLDTDRGGMFDRSGVETLLDATVTDECTLDQEVGP